MNVIVQLYKHNCRITSCGVISGSCKIWILHKVQNEDTKLVWNCGGKVFKKDGKKMAPWIYQKRLTLKLMSVQYVEKIFFQEVVSV